MSMQNLLTEIHFAWLPPPYGKGETQESYTSQQQNLQGNMEEGVSIPSDQGEKYIALKEL